MDFSADNHIFFADSPYSAVVGGESAPVLYDAPFRKEEVFEGQVENSDPACSMMDENVIRLGVKHGTALSVFKLQVSIGNFEVIGTEPDGMGITRLILTKVP